MTGSATALLKASWVPENPEPLVFNLQCSIPHGLLVQSLVFNPGSVWAIGSMFAGMGLPEPLGGPPSELTDLVPGGVQSPW